MPLITSTPYAKPSFETVITADNPLFWYRLGETSGTTAVDEVSARNGTYVNTPTLGEDGLVKGSDKAVLLNAAQSEYISLPNTFRIGTLSNHSIEVWADPTSGGYVYSENRSSGVIYTFYAAPTQVSFHIYTSSGWREAIFPTSLSAGTHHIVGTLSSTAGMKLYVDGVVEATNGNTNPTISGSLHSRYIGARWSGSVVQSFPSGTFDEVIAYNYPLTLEQVQEHYSYTA